MRSVTILPLVILHCLAVLARSPVGEAARPSGLGPLEITVAPRGPIPPERAEGFAELGVDRLVALHPFDAGRDGVLATIEAAHRALHGR